MKQVVQNLRTGILELMEVPCPTLSAGHLLIESHASLISAGTERSLVEFGKASLLAKARQNPDRVRQVLNKIKVDGLLPTLETVFRRLDEPLPLGYCHAGKVLEVAPEITNFAPGDRVASNGQHAQRVLVPVNLCARIPAEVSDEHASFAVLGSIALQGIRLLGPQLGEQVAVFGLGLVGLLTVQMLVASGVRVLGIDLSPQRLELARSFGATIVEPNSDTLRAARSFTTGHGIDGVLITASAKEDTIISQAARMSRQRGRIVLVGVVNMELDRREFYDKELTFQVSCSYGPGRYDPTYEQQGHDYPYAFVRWTEQRNIQAVLDLMAAGQLDPARLISHRFPHADAASAYELLSSGQSQLGVVLEYEPAESAQQTVVRRRPSPRAREAGKAVVGVIGAGNFTTGVLLPALRKTDARLVAIASERGLSAAHAAAKFDIAASTSNYRTILEDDEINTVVITTRHNQHAQMVIEALEAGKHVFVEKPLAIDADTLQDVRQAYEATRDQLLMVGFNRRFSPLTTRVRELLRGRLQPLCMVMMVNAGYIPKDHWAQDPHVGGGRIIGEGCHWIDLLLYLAGSSIQSVYASSIGAVASVESCSDHTTITLAFADGSLGTVHYFANGHRAFPKEQLTLFSEGRILYLDNFRSLRGYGWKGFRTRKLWRQDKGHELQMRRFVERVATGGAPLIPPDDLWSVTAAALQKTTPRVLLARQTIC